MKQKGTVNPLHGFSLSNKLDTEISQPAKWVIDSLSILIGLRICLDSLIADSQLSQILNLLLLAVTLLALLNIRYGLTFLWPFTFFQLLLLLHAYNNDLDLLKSAFFGLNLLIFWAMFRLVRALRTAFQQQLIKSLTVSVIFSSVFAVLEFVFQRSIIPTPFAAASLNVDTSRFGGLVAWPQIFGILCVLIFLTLGINQNYKKMRPGWRLVFIAMLILGVISSLTMTATAAGTVAYAVLVISETQKTVVLKRVILFAMTSMLVFFFTPLGERVTELSSLTRVFSVDHQSSNSFEWRVIQWRRTWSLVAENGFWGDGPLSAIRRPQLDGLLPHNDYLRLALEFGLFPIIALLLFVLTSIICKLKSLFGFQKSIFASSVTFIGLAAFTENILDQGMLYIALSITFGTIWSLHEQSEV